MLTIKQWKLQVFDFHLLHIQFHVLDAICKQVFALSSDWLIVLFVSVVIGQSNYFGFGL